MYSTINKFKFGNCSQCKNENIDVIKRGKLLFCTHCAKLNKAKEQMAKATERNKVRSLNQSNSKEQVEDRVVYKKSSGELDKSTLLKLADGLFSRFIKNRDTKEGKVLCPCCRCWFDIEAKDADGSKVVQPLHFISRSVYSLRYEPRQVFAGCCYCNKRQHDNPTGNEYLNFRGFLVSLYGSEILSDWEDERYKVNKLNHADLKNIINKYKTK